MKSMRKKAGRNDPCPCGSGRKYKKCCLTNDVKDKKEGFKSIYRFEAGSYGDVGGFMPSLANLKQTQKDEWEYHFILVKQDSVHSKEDLATAEAENDISEAYKVKSAGGSSAELALELKQKGYIRVDDFNIVNNSEFQA